MESVIIAGFAIAIVAIWLPNHWGSWRKPPPVIQDQGTEYVLQLLCFLIVFKIAATALCLGSGMHGGVFGPALCIGAMVGAARHGGCQLTRSLHSPAWAPASAPLSAPMHHPDQFELNQTTRRHRRHGRRGHQQPRYQQIFRSILLVSSSGCRFDINAGREVLILNAAAFAKMETDFKPFPPMPIWPQ